jgi:DNA-directed RNA polymerase specialized sigma24 family protein
MNYTPDPDLDAKVSVAYQCGYSFAQIARRLGLSVGHVRSCLRRTNTATRSISEAKKLRKGVV